MSRRRTVVSLVVVVLAGLAAYAATVAGRAASASSPPDGAGGAVASWLNLPAEQREAVSRADPSFEDDAARLRGEVAEKKQALARLLEQPESSDEAVMGGLEEVIAASNALERRTARYLLSVRRHLTPEQQKRLLSLCAEEVRQGRRYQWGRRQDSPQPDGSGAPGPRGRQGGQGRGRPWGQ